MCYIGLIALIYYVSRSTRLGPPLVPLVTEVQYWRGNKECPGPGVQWQQQINNSPDMRHHDQTCRRCWTMFGKKRTTVAPSTLGLPYPINRVLIDNRFCFGKSFVDL